MRWLVADRHYHSKLVNFIPGEFLWQTDPGTYLTNYFTNEPQRVKLTFEEFLGYLGLKETQLDEIASARIAFDQQTNLVKAEK